MRTQEYDVLKDAYNTAVAAEDEETAALLARMIRNKELIDTDSEMVSDRPSDKEAWAAYRQELRDITAQPGFPFVINWPVSPDDPVPFPEV